MYFCLLLIRSHGASSSHGHVTRRGNSGVSRGGWDTATVEVLCCWPGEEKVKNEVCWQGVRVHTADNDSLTSQDRSDNGAISVQMTGAYIILLVDCWWFTIHACAVRNLLCRMTAFSSWQRKTTAITRWWQKAWWKLCRYLCHASSHAVKQRLIQIIAASLPSAFLRKKGEK